MTTSFQRNKGSPFLTWHPESPLDVRFENVGIFMHRRELVVEQLGKGSVFFIRVDMGKVDVLPCYTGGSFIPTSLSLLVLLFYPGVNNGDMIKNHWRERAYLYSRFFSTSLIVVLTPDPFCDLVPKLSTLPLALLFYGLNGDLLLRLVRIQEQRPTLLPDI